MPLKISQQRDFIGCGFSRSACPSCDSCLSFQEAGNRVVPEGDGPYLVEPRSTYAYIPGHPVPQVDSEFPIGQFLRHHPLEWVGKLCLSPTCLGLFSSYLLETKQVVAIWGAHAEPS